MRILHGRSASLASHGLCARTTLLFLFAAVLAFLVPTRVAAAEKHDADGTTGRPSWVANELLVARHRGISRSSAESIYRSHGATIVEEIHQIRLHVIRVPASALENVEKALSRRPEVEFVERNHLLLPGFTPNDTYYSQQWHLPRISAPSAWELTVGDPGVVVAILDSGVDPSHPDLAANLVPGYNFYDANTDTSDVTGHGTQVAGTVAAVSDNGIGVASVAWLSRLMPIRVSSSSGSASVSTIAKGLTWASDHGARIMNVSFNDVAKYSTITNAAKYVVDKGGLVVASAGNCGCFDSTPENPYIISVAATTSKDGRARFSSSGDYVDVAAPGVSIITTASGGGYATVSGTSFSSPVTAGVLALMMSANPGLGPWELESLLETTTDDLGAAGYDTSFGFGLVNAAAAVNAAAEESSPPPDTTPPSVSISSPDDGSAVSGTASVEVVAFDDHGVSRVDLYVDGALLESDTAAPFSFTWDTSSAESGWHDLQATAYDAAGNTGSSPVVRVLVEDPDTIPPDSDTTPPEAQITSPSDGSTVTRTVKIDLSATDDRELSALEVLVDGVSLGAGRCSGSSCTATFVWKTQKESHGAHVISGLAYDAAGNVGEAASVTVSVR